MTDTSRVCMHGALRRQCEACQLAGDLEVMAAERDALREEVEQERTAREKAERERDEAKKDALYHADCRPNRRQAEAAMADAKAINDRWADEVAAHRATTQRAEQAEARVRELVERFCAFNCDADGSVCECPAHRIYRREAQP